MNADSVRVWVESVPPSSSETDWIALCLQVLLVAFGAFLGAYFAFHLQGLRERRKTRRGQVDAARAAQFVVFTQRDFLTNVRNQLLEQHRNDPNRWLKLLPFGTHVTVPSLSLDSLRFLFESSDPDLPNRLKGAEATYQIARGVLENRNLAISEFQRRLEAYERSLPQRSRSLPIQQIEDAIGPELTHRLKKLTDALYLSTDDGLERIDAVLKDLRTVLKAQFPGEKFLDLKNPERTDQNPDEVA